MSFVKRIICDGCKGELLDCKEHIKWIRKTKHTHKQLHACSTECRDRFNLRVGKQHKWSRYKKSEDK